jgi:hypothetical protein
MCWRLSSAHPVDLGAQSNLIGAPERMSIEAVLAAPNGGYFVATGVSGAALRDCGGSESEVPAMSSARWGVPPDWPTLCRAVASGQSVSPAVKLTFAVATVPARRPGAL